MRKVQWATLVAKREKLRDKVASLSSAEDELEQLERQIAEHITPEAIDEAKAKVLRLRVDLERAEATLSGLEEEAARLAMPAEAATEVEADFADLGGDPGPDPYEE
jgi:hypothetical protein